MSRSRDRQRRSYQGQHKYQHESKNERVTHQRDNSRNGRKKRSRLQPQGTDSEAEPRQEAHRDEGMCNPFDERKHDPVPSPSEAVHASHSQNDKAREYKFPTDPEGDFSKALKSFACNAGDKAKAIFCGFGGGGGWEF